MLAISIHQPSTWVEWVYSTMVDPVSKLPMHSNMPVFPSFRSSSEVVAKPVCRHPWCCCIFCSVPASQVRSIFWAHTHTPHSLESADLSGRAFQCTADATAIITHTYIRQTDRQACHIMLASPRTVCLGGHSVSQLQQQRARTMKKGQGLACLHVQRPQKRHMGPLPRGAFLLRHP